MPVGQQIHTEKWQMGKKRKRMKEGQRKGKSMRLRKKGEDRE